jgi:hypothetical protein
MRKLSPAMEGATRKTGNAIADQEVPGKIAIARVTNVSG